MTHISVWPENWKRELVIVLVLVINYYIWRVSIKILKLNTFLQNEINNKSQLKIIFLVNPTT